MAKRDRNRRSNRTLSRRFVALEGYLLDSLAWRSLRLPARCALVEILARYNGSNNGRIAMSANILAMLLSVSRATATRALQELMEHEIVVPGSFSCKIKRATEYRVTFRRCDVTGDLPSKAFMRWQPKIQNTASPQSNDGFTTEQRSRKAA